MGDQTEREDRRKENDNQSKAKSSLIGQVKMICYYLYVF
jgi:hypothetical protein